jgi:DNA repair photolyase/NTP pyrophosphatase (non-canonical NTP hydrolase)
MSGKPIPLVAQHESWISLDPVQGCPASCVYCYLEPSGLTRRIPGDPIEAPESTYQRLSEYHYLEKSRFSDVPVGRSFPIAIGNYTDVCLTSKNRQFLLAALAHHKQRMPAVPVCIVTKAALELAFLETINRIGVKVIFFISLSFLPSQFEKGAPPAKARLKNFERIALFDNIEAVHFWRPVTSVSIPNRTAAASQIELLKSAGAKLSVVTGLKFGDNLAKTFRANEQHPFHEFFSAWAEQSHLQNEILEPDVQEVILSVAQELSYPVFLHTSCAVSYVLEQPDYNATFRKPHLETRCLASTCPSAQRKRCFSFKARFTAPSQTLLEQVARYLDLPSASVTYSVQREVIFVDCVLTQEEQTYLTQATGFPVRGKDLVPTLEWIGSINRLGDMHMKVSDMVEMTREVTRLFDRDVGEWNVNVMVTELVGEVGTLADSIMIQEGHRPSRNGDHIDLEDDIVDILFMLIRIADHYKVDLESAYSDMIKRTRRKLEDRLSTRKYQE